MPGTDFPYRQFFIRPGQNETCLYAHRLQDCQNLPKLTRWLSFLQLNDEPQACAGGHRLILLGHPHALARVSNHVAYGLGCLFHVTER